MRVDERALAALAAQQHLVATSGELAALGVTSAMIAARVRAGRFQRLHHGVYLIAPVPAQWTHERAALLACGERSVLSHRTAAAVWRIRPSVDGPIDVTVAGSGVRRRAGVRVRRTAGLAPDDITTHAGLRVTTPARTLLDLAATLSTRDFDRVLSEARAQRVVTATELHSLLARSSQHRGATRLTRALVHDPGPTRSEAERLFLDLVRRAHLPAPQVNVRVAGHEVDFFWPDHNLVVEVDGYAFHSTRAAFERDRRRDADLRRAGCSVERVTVAQIRDDALALAADLARELSFPLRASGPSARRSRPSTAVR
jgi:very-short-patch-repair endonuclease